MLHRFVLQHFASIAKFNDEKYGLRGVVVWIGIFGCTEGRESVPSFLEVSTGVAFDEVEFLKLNESGYFGENIHDLEF